MEEVTRNVDMFEFVTISEHFDATCGTFAETSSAVWSVKEGCEKVLTRNMRTASIKLLKLLAIGQDRNITCATYVTFAEASLAGWSVKDGSRNV